MRQFLTISIIISFASLASSQQASALERAAQQSNDRREQMTLYYQAAEKYMPTNPTKAALVAHQAYLIAQDLKDNIMAARSAYMNGEGFARQNKYEDARLRFERGKDAAVDGKDFDFGAKCLDRMAQMARYKGNTQDAEAYKIQATNLRRRVGGGTTAANANNSGGTAPPTNTSAPTNQAELNAVKEQYRTWFENLQQQRRKLETEVAALQRDRQTLNTEMISLQKRQQDLTNKTEVAQQTIEEQKGALATISTQKEELNRVASRKQRLLEALSSEKALDSLAFAQERQEQEYLLQKTKNFRNVLILVLAFAIVIVGLVYRRFLENQKQKKILEEKNRMIEDERQRSDELLLNILPASIATELKTDGKAKAQRYEQASVMFIDFKSFTKISEQLTPEDLVHELDTYFKAFDFIVGQYKLEKIKTIGDAYMVASGLSDRITTPLSIVKAALEIQEFLNDMRIEKSRDNRPYFEARIGIHAGPVVAGVVGVKKFAYDIWGDTVNIASRVQDACEPGRINISEKVFNEIRYSFQCHYRGKVHAKNKGDIDMYYVEKALKS